MAIRGAALVVAALLCLAGPSHEAVSVANSQVFGLGEEGYSAFRIPGILGVQDVVLAVAEGRKYGCGDFSGQHDVVLKRSEDGGHTWSPLQVVADPTRLFGCTDEKASGHCEFWDPTLVFEAKSGTAYIVAAYTNSEAERMGGAMSVFLWASSDLGKTWSARPQNITAQIQTPHAAVVTPANGHGIQMVGGKYDGRLVVPAYTRPPLEAAAILYSDDRGHSWHTVIADNCPEAVEGEVVQMFADPDSLFYSFRIESKGRCGAVAHCRGSSVSRDGGLTWANLTLEPALADPECKGGVSRFDPSKALLLSNDLTGSGRVNITLSVSRDDGATWPEHHLISSPGGYTDVTQASTGAALVIYENSTCHVDVGIVTGLADSG